MAERFDRRRQDTGNILFLEHVNVKVPDQTIATVFYVQGLGFTRDPYLMVGTENMWINIGQQQFHLPTGKPQAQQGAAGHDSDEGGGRCINQRGHVHAPDYALGLINASGAALRAPPPARHARRRKVMTARTRKTKNNIFAMPAAPAAMPPKPRIAATMAMMKNTTA